MTTQDKEQTTMTMVSARSKQAYFAELQRNHTELSRNQREYKKKLSTRLKTRSELILERSLPKAIESLRNERNDLRAQIWVANARCHTEADKIYLQQIECHIECQERLSEEIAKLKHSIGNIQREKARTDKKIFELNLKTTESDAQYQDFVAQLRKNVKILENRLETSVRHECEFTAENVALRKEIGTMVTQRELFNSTYMKYVQKLHGDQKYMMDLMAYATHACEGGIDTNEKILNARKKSSKESEQAKMRVQSIMRGSAAAELAAGFMDCKNQIRPLADLEHVEIRRRNNFKFEHIRKIRLYNTVLERILEFTQSNNVTPVIEKFQQNEELYHSYFTIANRLSFHLTSLETPLELLCEVVSQMQQKNKQKFTDQKVHVSELQLRLEEQRANNAKLKARLLSHNKHFDYFCGSLAAIFTMCLADPTPLMRTLGNHSSVNVHNFKGFMKILEARILNIVRNVYVKERKQQEGAMPADFAVQELTKFQDQPTNLNDIVMTQQCAECAEVEVLNTAEDTHDGGVDVMSIADVKKKLMDDINQPEIQYRLHSISKCRLPRSRLLAAKRYA